MTFASGSRCGAALLSAPSHGPIWSRSVSVCLGDEMKFGALFLVPVLVAGVPASAVAQDEHDAFIGVAYSKHSGFVVFAHGHDEETVTAELSDACAKADVSDCKTDFVGSNICISLARSGDDKEFGIAVESSRAASQERALSECTGANGKGCNIHDTYCAPSTLE